MYDLLQKSLEMGESIANKHRTIMVDLQPHSAIEGLLKNPIGKDLSDLMYFMESKGQNIGMLLSGMTLHYKNLDILAAMKGQNDLTDISVDKWKLLIDSIEKDTDYEYVILIMSDAVRGLYDLLQMSDEIITVIGKDPVSDHRMKCYEESLEQVGMADILDKTCRTWEVKGIEKA